MKTKKILSDNKGVIWFFVGVLFLYLLNYYTPLYADDYNYAYSFATGKRIQTLSEIFPSMKAHYYQMNGRLVLHAIAQVFLMIGKPYFNVINALAYMILLLLTGYHAYGSVRKIQVRGMFVAFMLIWWCIPEFGQSFLWVTGSSNYLYGVLIILIFLIPYRRYLENIEYKSTILLEIVLILKMGVFGVIAGWTNENMSIALIFIELCFLVAYRIQRKAWKLWMLSGIIGTVIGCIIMLTAPAQNARLQAVGGMGGAKEFVIRGIHITMNLFDFLLPILILFLFLAYRLNVKKVVSVTLSKKEMLITFIKRNFITIIYGLGAMVSIYSMVAVPVFAGRAWSGPIILCCITLGTLHDRVEKETDSFSSFYHILLLFLGISFLFTYGEALVYIKRTYQANQERIVSINQQKSEGRTEIMLPVIFGYTKYTCYSDKLSDGDLSPYQDYWGNIIIARYYDVETIHMEQ